MPGHEGKRQYFYFRQLSQYLYNRRFGTQDGFTNNSIIWTKPNAQPNITCRMFTESTEQVLWLCNNSAKKAKKWTFNYHDMKELNGGKQMRNYWEIPLTPKREKNSR